MSRTFCLLALGIMMQGCEQIFEPLEADDPQMGVSATFSPLVDVADPDLGFMVFLTPVVPFSAGPNDSFIEGALVELYSGNQLLTTFVEGSIGPRRVYASFLKPEPGKSYTLRISDPEYGVAEATDRLPGAVTASILGYSDLELTDLPENKQRINFTIELEIEDKPIEEDYYHIYLEYRLTSDPSNRRFFQIANAEQNDPAITPFLLSQSILLDGRQFDGEKKTLKLTCQADLDPGEEILNVQSEFRHVSFNYYQFHRTQAIQVSNGGSPVVEPTPLFSNVSGGVGFFGGFNPTRDTIQLN